MRKLSWVQRNNSNAITGVYANKQPGYAEEELADNDAAIITFLNKPPVDQIDQWDILTLKIAFNHENRIRVLEGKPTITIIQFKTALKAL